MLMLGVLTLILSTNHIRLVRFINRPISVDQLRRWNARQAVNTDTILKVLFQTLRVIAQRALIGLESSFYLAGSR